MRVPLSLAGLLGKSQLDVPATSATSTQPVTEVERSAASLIRILGGKNEALRNRCEHVIGLTRVIEPLTNELSAVFTDFQKVVGELQQTTGLLEETRAKLDAQRQLSETQSLEIQALFIKLEEVRKDNERLLNDNVTGAQNYSVLDEQFRATRDQLSEKITTLRSREFELENVKNENEVLQEDLGRSMLRTREAEMSVTELQDEKRNLNDKIAQQGDEVLSLSRSVDDLTQQTMLLKKQVLEASASADKYRTRIRLLETDQVALQAENESLRGAVANAEARAEQIRSSYEIKIEALNSRIRVSEQLLVQSRDEIRRLSDEQVRYSEQGREIESLQARVSEITADSNIAQRRAEDAERALSLANQRNGDLFGKLQSAEELNRQAASRIDSMQSTILRFESESELRINTLQARINQLTESLNKEQIERGFVEGALEAARRDRVQMQQTIFELKSGNSGNNNASEPGPQLAVDNAKSTLEKELDEIKSDLMRSHTEVPTLRSRAKAKKPKDD
jgi:chromosome segregation ATPase